MGRLGQPEVIAEMACYLAGDLSAFTTGQALAIDGGGRPDASQLRSFDR